MTVLECFKAFDKCTFRKLLDTGHGEILGEMKEKQKNSLNNGITHIIICSKPYFYTIVVQKVYNQECSEEIDIVEGLAV